MKYIKFLILMVLMLFTVNGAVNLDRESNYCLNNEGCSLDYLNVGGLSVTTENITINKDLYLGDINVYEDLRVPVTSINPIGGASDPDFDTTNICYRFDDSAEEVVFIIVQMPHTWDEGSLVEPHLHFETLSTNTGNINISMRWKWLNIGEAGNTWTTDSTLCSASGVAYNHTYCSLGVFDGSGKTFSSIVSVELSRQGSGGGDDFVGDICVKEFDIHYRVEGWVEKFDPT